MAITRAKKEMILSKLEDKFQKADAAVFAQYKGMSVPDLEDARHSFREGNIDYFIAKKTLIKKAAKDILGLEISDESLEGAVGVAFGYEDVVALCKTLAKVQKDKEQFEIIGGVIDKQLVDKVFVEEMSKMLSRPELLAKFAGMLKSPLNAFGSMLNSGTTSFARALSEYAKQKSE